MLLSLLVLLYGLQGVGLATQPNAANVETHSSFLHVTANQPLSAEELKTIAVFEKAAKSVAYITNTAVRRDFFSLNTFEVPQGSGSGFIWSSKGYIVTNFHVVYGADSIQVVLDDQSTHDARVIGVDPDHDLAVLQVNAAKKQLPPLDIGNSQNLQVGNSSINIVSRVDLTS
jgi:S1-C subfamily serine protease